MHRVHRTGGCAWVVVVCWDDDLFLPSQRILMTGWNIRWHWDEPSSWISPWLGCSISLNWRVRD